MSVQILNEQHWHNLRAENVGASEVSALFSASPYTTRFTLWHQKAGKIAMPDFESERMKWGNLLEPVIAKALAEEKNWSIRKVRRYITHPTVKGMGASLDYEIFNHADGVGCFEIKNLSIEAWKKNWVKHEDGTIEAPLNIELQLQHQLAVTGRPWGAIGFLVGGNEGHIVIRKRHEPTIQKIEAAVKEFWESIAKEEVPSIESAGDLATVTQLFDGAKTIEIDDEFSEAIEHYQIAQATAKDAEINLNLCKAVLIDHLSKEDAESAFGNGFSLTYKKQTRKEHTVKSSEFRVLRVAMIKENK